MLDFAEFKKFFLFNMIGSLVIAALVAVVSILIGDFGEIAMKALLTLMMVIIHSLVALTFIWDDEKQNTFENLSFFIGTFFILIVISFVVSIFGVWDIISGKVLWNIYQLFFVIAFSALHGNFLSKAMNKENYIDMIVYTNYLFLLLVAIMLQPIIFIDNSTRVLGSIFFRILGASAIINGTLSIITIIFYKLYLHKHPEVGRAVSKTEF